MDTIFIRNFLIFVVTLFLCVGTLLFYLVNSEGSIQKIDDNIDHSYAKIDEIQKFSSIVTSMLSSQRGFIISGDETLLEQYEEQKSIASEHIANLSELMTDNPSQASRLEEVRNYYTQFSIKLEERAGEADDAGQVQPFNDIDVISGLQEDIIRINNKILEEERELLEELTQILEARRKTYYTSLIIGLIVGTTLLIIFNGFLLRTQQKRSKAERSLKSSEDRFTLAVEGTQDGVFDWDIENNRVFYSKKYFALLGEERASCTDEVDVFLDRLHEDEKEQVWAVVEQYLAGELSEYAQEFRMKHASGRWVWVQARAKALFDKNGKAYRMVGAHTDITHLKKAQEKLEADKQEAMEANRAKSEFLAHMSHEIRTPLTAISGIAEILTKQSKDFSEKQRQLVGTLSNSTATLKELVNDVLDFSKIESGEIELHDEVFELDKIFEETISMMAIKANEKGISFVFDYDIDNKTSFLGDGMRVRQILVNLVSNAIKFTNEGGVTIKAAYEDRDNNEYLRVDVSDTGIGIEPENFDIVFERFKQADASVSRRFGGTGLGLPISKKLSQMMGGDIFVSSEFGKGSTFSLILPARLADVQSKPERSGLSNRKLTDKIRAALDDDYKVLIVEDYEGNIVVVEYILEELGLKYDVTRNGREGFEAWKEKHYDLILMDIQMPEMDGFTATHKIRETEKQEGLEATPIIGMTAHALVADKDRCIQAGMSSYLPKPLVENDLKREILKHLSKEKKAA